MNIVLFDEKETWREFLPLTFTRPLGGLRIGILSIAEKWKFATKGNVGFLTQPHLQKKFPLIVADDSICVNGACCPNPDLLAAITALKKEEALFFQQQLIACYGDPQKQEGKKRVEFRGQVLVVKSRPDLFTKNHEALLEDFNTITRGRRSETISDTVIIIGDRSLVFLEKGAKAEACIFNTTSGPVYLAAGSEVMEGSAVRGPFSLGEHSTLKLNTKIYGATTIGPHCKVGGEVNNSVIFGYSNKAHDGFLGNSVIGEWCNLGADTNNSNLKNNYGNVKLYSYRSKAAADTGLQFCGLIMGDHSKCGINTMFNTGTVAGVGSNIFGGSFPPTHIPSFSWGGSEGLQQYRLDKMFETTEKVFARRGIMFDETEKQLLTDVQRLAAGA